jgi:transposase
LTGVEGTVARVARSLVERCRHLPSEINQLQVEITGLVEQLVPTLLAVVGVGPLTAAKILGETAGVDRFVSKGSYASTPAPRP